MHFTRIASFATALLLAGSRAADAAATDSDGFEKIVARSNIENPTLGQRDLGQHNGLPGQVRAVAAAAALPQTTGTGVWRSTASSATIWITTASVYSRCGAAFGTRTVCATPTASCKAAANGISTCAPAGATPQTTGTGLWKSTGSATTIWVTTATAKGRCGAASGTRTVCQTPAATCKYVSPGFSTCALSAAATSPSSSSSTPAPTGGSSSSSNLDAPYGAISDILKAHNAARATHGANPLTWSSSLTSLAKSWADKCVWQHGGANGAGQNLAAAGGTGGSASQTGQQVVDAWMSEEAQYDPNNPTYSHFTQVVWKSTTQLGCWQSSCANFVDGSVHLVFPAQYLPAKYTVCNYLAAVRLFFRARLWSSVRILITLWIRPCQGNVIGQFAQNVQKAS